MMTTIKNKSLWTALRHRALSLRVQAFEDRDQSKSYREFERALRDRLAFALGWHLVSLELARMPRTRFALNDGVHAVAGLPAKAIEKILKSKEVPKTQERLAIAIVLSGTACEGVRRLQTIPIEGHPKDAPMVLERCRYALMKTLPLPTTEVLEFEEWQNMKIQRSLSRNAKLAAGSDSNLPERPPVVPAQATESPTGARVSKKKTEAVQGTPDALPSQVDLFQS